MAKLDDQIATLQHRLQLVKLRQQRLDARKQAVTSLRMRKSDTRRKILLGALILQKMADGEIERQRVTTWLDLALTRSADRALFGLPPIAGNGSEPETRLPAADETAKR